MDFWFGPIEGAAMPTPARQARWFKATAENDRICKTLFLDAVTQALTGDLDYWRAENDSLVALVILLDQLTRNLFRGRPEAFAGDARALEIALNCIATGRDKDLPLIHRVFLYLPLEHSENLAMQDRCIALFDELIAAGNEPRIAEFRRYAIAHRDVIARFGRFPHRNAILGRGSTTAELAYLDRHGGF
jgi:uncharacterized protein (DUF924 family)